MANSEIYAWCKENHMSLYFGQILISPGTFLWKTKAKNNKPKQKCEIG